MIYAARILLLFSYATSVIFAQTSELAMETIRNSILNDALVNTAQATRSFLNNQHGENSLRNLRHITTHKDLIPTMPSQQLLNDDIEFVASLAQTLLVSEEKQQDDNNNTALEKTIWSDSMLVSDLEPLKPNSVQLIPKIKFNDDKSHFQPHSQQEPNLSQPDLLATVNAQEPIPAKNMLCHVHESRLHCTTLVIENIVFDPKECKLSSNGIMACERNISF